MSVATGRPGSAAGGRLGEEERRALAELSADFAREQLAPRSAALDRADGDAFDECWAAIRELGLERAVLPAELGGPGLAPVELLGPLTELARGDAGVALCVLLSNAALLALPFEQVADVGPGERWAAVPVPTAPAAGGGVLRIESGEGEPALSGSIRSALGAGGAAGIVVLPGTAPGRALALAGARGGGCTAHTSPSQMGLRSARAVDLELTDAVASDVGSAEATRVMILWGLAAIARGIGLRAYELALAYAESRQQGGKAIVEHGAVRELLAAMATRARECGGDLAAAGDSGTVAGTTRPGTPTARLDAALAAKVRCCDDALAIATDAVQVLGGAGYIRETGVEKLMRDARYCQLYPEPPWVTRDRLLELDRAASAAPLT